MPPPFLWNFCLLLTILGEECKQFITNAGNQDPLTQKEVLTMKRVFMSFIAFSLLIPFLMSCNEGKQKVTVSQSSEINEQVTAFTHVNLVPMTDETIVKDPVSYTHLTLPTN